MLIVNKSGSSNVVITAYENAVNKINPYFIFEIINKDTKDNIIFSNDDLSTSNYWNEYMITVATSSIGLTSGTIPIYSGEWNYNIYEMVNRYDLDINNAVGLVENGIMLCLNDKINIDSLVVVDDPIPFFEPVSTSTTTTTTTNRLLWDENRYVAVGLSYYYPSILNFASYPDPELSGEQCTVSIYSFIVGGVEYGNSQSISFLCSDDLLVEPGSFGYNSMNNYISNINTWMNSLNVPHIYFSDDLTNIKSESGYTYSIIIERNYNYFGATFYKYDYNTPFSWADYGTTPTENSWIEYGQNELYVI